MLRHVGKVRPAPGGMVNVGPIVDVTLSPCPVAQNDIIQSGMQVPYLPSKMMVDTGAQISCIEDQILSGPLGLKPIRFMPLTGVSGKAEMRPVYRMAIAIMMADSSGTNQGPAIFTADVVGVPSPETPQVHKGLLGRDFLMHVRFVYEGQKGEFQIIDTRTKPVGSGKSKTAFDRKKAKAKKKKQQQASRKKNRKK